MLIPVCELPHVQRRYQSDHARYFADLREGLALARKLQCGPLLNAG